MTKSKRKPKQSKHWKKLRCLHRKGPKRVKIPKPRKKNGVDPLLVRENVNFVHVELPCGNICTVIMFKTVFSQLNLKVSETYTMPIDRLTPAGRCLKKIYHSFGHNDFILKCSREIKMDNIVGRCLVFCQAFTCPDAILKITKSTKDLEQEAERKRHIEELYFERTNITNTENVEYM